jgi:hypothetical protein
MKKFYLVNYETTETVYFNTNNEAFEEAQKRNRYDLLANWKAYTEQGDVIFGLVVVR